MSAIFEKCKRIYNLIVEILIKGGGIISKIGNALKMAVMLQSRGRMKSIDLARELEVSERQIREYRSYLEQAGIFIFSKSGVYGGYELSNDGNLLNLNIKSEDITVIEMVNEQMKFNNDIYKKEFQEIVNKVKATINMKNGAKESMNYFVVEPKGNFDIEEEKKKYREINIAFITKKKMKIKYYSLSSGLSERVVHPYVVYSYKSDK
ncbi:HTH domain-containing protein [Clostridium cavendishii DSM 21758]|uniref:HTH domain-containing protein n=1 Tax=Clostridium cavendishii DSM 21758 TaxID=1121302 RepID=A0A1M6NEE4_9CLOT|nr:HTH domain-containing protein [Clostridium cavendishii]SHJ93984.1 HTH domain-containing protein [Clostridium cavendishii DSM 21758]